MLRPAGLNEPTQEAVRGTQEILRRVRSLLESDVCIVLLSGGAKRPAVQSDVGDFAQRQAICDPRLQAAEHQFTS